MLCSRDPAARRDQNDPPTAFLPCLSDASREASSGLEKCSCSLGIPSIIFSCLESTCCSVNWWIGGKLALLGGWENGATLRSTFSEGLTVLPTTSEIAGSGRGGSWFSRSAILFPAALGVWVRSTTAASGVAGGACLMGELSLVLDARLLRLFLEEAGTDAVVSSAVGLTFSVGVCLECVPRRDLAAGVTGAGFCCWSSAKPASTSNPLSTRDDVSAIYCSTSCV